jgi:uncharacterized protein (TIGR00255 family)
MALRSMTGFARFDGTAGGVRFHWELRSVNGRGLDMRLRLPPGLEALEAPVREAIGRRVSRGNVSATLVLETAVAGSDIRINERALATVLAAVDRLAKRDDFDRARPEGILALRGVLETGDAPGGDTEALHKDVLAGLGVALDALTDARLKEGGKLATVFADQVARIETLVGQITRLPARQPEAVRARLAEQVQRVVGAGGSGLDPDRLHQEAILLATRADVEEEIKRLGAHISAARGLLADAAPVGRRLDFLAQEFNREANTICSKSTDIEMTRLGLELKAVIDQLREQVQNIE